MGNTTPEIKRGLMVVQIDRLGDAIAAAAMKIVQKLIQEAKYGKHHTWDQTGTYGSAN